MEGEKNDIGWVDFTYQWDVGRRWDDAFSQFVWFSNVNQRELIVWITIKTRVNILSLLTLLACINLRCQACLLQYVVAIPQT